MHELTVKSVTFLNEDIFEIAFEREAYSFTPGDCVSLFKSPKTLRPYSLASGQDENELRFIIRKMSDGEVSPWLSARQPGDKVQASPPFGWFRPGQSEENERSIFIATGTGIAPFVSFMNSFPERRPERCLYGVRQYQDAVHVDLIRSKCELALAASREKHPECHHGRVTDLLETLPREADIHYYLCGLDAMIDEVADWLEDKGVDFTQIHREVFFHVA